MNKISIKLGSKEVFNSSKPYIIAEIGVNHEGSIETALKLIDLAKEGGADAAKFQSYTASKLASKNSPSYWDLSKENTTSQYELFQKYDSFGKDEFTLLYEHCQKKQIDFISTPFDDDAVDFLAPIVPFYKIASADITNIPMLRRIAKKRKSIVLSTGASTISEIEQACDLLTQNGTSSIALLHCILNYPTPDELANLSMIGDLIDRFPEFIIGYSDHTVPDEYMTCLVSAYSAGAVIIEKHFTDDKSLPGNDHYHAMDINDLKKFRMITNRIHSMQGLSEGKAPIPSEEISRKNARRSIVACRKIKAGELISENNITYKRPCFGISTSHWDSVIGTRVIKEIKEDDFVTWDKLEG